MKLLLFRIALLFVLTSPLQASSSIQDMLYDINLPKMCYANYEDRAKAYPNPSDFFEYYQIAENYYGSYGLDKPYDFFIDGKEISYS